MLGFCEVNKPLKRLTQNSGPTVTGLKLGVNERSKFEMNQYLPFQDLISGSGQSGTQVL